MESEVSQETQDYDDPLRSGKKRAALSIPLPPSTSDGQSYCFAEKPVVGGIECSYFKKLATDLLGRSARPTPHRKHR
jgi:hypothetical protein